MKSNKLFTSIPPFFSPPRGSWRGLFFTLLSSLFTLTLLSSCERDIGAAHMGIPSCIVAYCMPTVGDTTDIQVTRSVAMDEYTVDDTGDRTTYSRPTAITNARISYKVNGVEQTAVHKADGLYQVACQQKPGDRIDLTIEAEGLKTVTAHTIVPDTMKIDRVEAERVQLYNADSEMLLDYDQLRLTFTDPPQQGDCYAVRVVKTTYTGNVSVFSHDEYAHIQQPFDKMNIMVDKITPQELQAADSIRTYIYGVDESDALELFTQGEPVLDSRASIDDLFENNFLGNFYIFDDSYFNGRSYTLHLNVPSHYYDGLWWEYTVELYRLTPEYYRFVKSLNDKENNELAEYGLSQIAPTLSNIEGGVGLLGGMACSRHTGISLYPEYKKYLDLTNFIERAPEIYY